MKTILIISIIGILATGYLVACRATNTIETINNERNTIIAKIK